jgi:protein-glutamine gamma-glutamyltransferase
VAATRPAVAPLRERLRGALAWLTQPQMSSAARERRDAMVLLIAVACVALPHARELPVWTTGVIVLLWGWRAFITLANRPMPGHIAMIPLLLATMAAVWLQYRTLLGREAGVTLLLLLLALKLLEMRATRDVFVVVFLCFFVLLTQYLNGQELPIALVTTGAALALFFVLVSVSLKDGDIGAGRKLRLVAMMALKAIPLTIVLFVLFPRLNHPLWGLPKDAGTGRTGLSDSMSPGNINQLLNSDAIAFRAQFDGVPPANESLYWRGPVLGSFDGRTWREAGRPLVTPPSLSVQIDTASRVGYTVTLEPHQRDWLFALDVPIQLPADLALPARLQADGQLRAEQRITQRVRYSMNSATRYVLGGNETELSLQDSLQLPSGFNPRAMQFAVELRNRVAAAASQRGEADAALADAVLAHFRDNGFRYTLEPPRLGVHTVDEFMFDTRLGYCEFYASAFVFLMRAMDVPARVVTGYQGGEMNPVDGFLIVRQSDAHAWAEVWLRGRGWVRVDPTAVVAPVRIQRGADALQAAQPGGTPLFSLGGGGQSPITAVLRTLRFNWEAMENRWNQWVINYSADRQMSMLAALGFERNWQVLGALLALGGSLALGVMAYFSLRHRQRRDPLADLDLRFRTRLEAAGVKVRPADGPQRLLDTVRRELSDDSRKDAAEILRELETLRYSPASRTAGARELLRLRGLIRRFRPRLAAE